MHQNDDDIDLAVTLKDLHVSDTLVDPPIAGVEPIECTSERRQPFAEFVKKQVQSGEFSRDDDVTVNIGALVDSHFHEVIADEFVRHSKEALLNEAEKISRDGLLTTPYDLDVDEKGCISRCLPSFDELLKETETLSRETLVFNFHYARELKREYFMRLLHAADVEADLSRQVEFLLAEKDGLTRQLESMTRDIDMLRLAAVRVNDVRLDEMRKERDEAIYHGQQIRNTLEFEREKCDATKKELFEVGIQMKNAAAHARHLVDCIDEFEKDLDKNTPYTAIKDFLRKARTYDGETVYGSISDAIDILAKELLADKEPGSYYDSWIANIAMSMLTELESLGENKPKKQHDFVMLFNAGARRFIDLLTIKQRSITGEK